MSTISLQARQPLVNGGDGVNDPFQRTQSRDASPESRAGLLGFVTFSWFTPLIDLAFTRNQQQQKLEPSDLYPLGDRDTAEKQFQRLYEHWQIEEHSPRPSLMRALRKTFFGEVLKTAWLQFCNVCLQFMTPLLLHKILGFVKDPSTSLCLLGGSTWCIPEGYLYAVALVSSSFVGGCLSAHYFQMGYRNGMHIRASLILLAYHKALRVLPWAPPPPPPAPEPSPEEQRRQQRRFFRRRARPQPPAPMAGGMGQVTNLISTDTDRFTFLMPYFNVMWSGMVQVIVAFTMLFVYVSWSVFAGIAVMGLMTTFSTYIQKKARAMQAKVMKAKDQRLKMEVEMLKIVKIIKLYAWENTIEDKVKELRNAEMHHQFKFKLFSVFIFISFSLSPVLVSLATFTCYTAVLGKDLDAETAFPALALFNILRFPLGMMPMVVGFYMQAKVAKDRLQAFFLAPEVSGRPGLPPTKDNTIELKASSLVWPNTSVLLNKVDFSARKGEFVVIAGKTGAGKSGLLYALLGELPIAEADGAAYLSGSVGYCAQVAWVRNTSLKNNITGGTLGEERRYEEVLDACALRADLAALPQGDATMIGDRGINLSGGQKQRVALARAIFANKDMYVLDDVLSALDAHVTGHICTNLLQGPLMRGKTVVLVTHSRRAMKLADRIYWLADKEVRCFSTFDEFRASNLVDQLEDKEEEQKPIESNSKADEKEETKKDAGSEKKKEKMKGTQQEERRAGSVSRSVYLEYVKACGGFLPVGWFLCCIALSEGSKNLSDFWLVRWTEMGGTPSGAVVYGLIALLSCGMSVNYVVTRIFLGQRGSRKLHEACVNALLRAQMVFYDQTPTGQILNRLAEDTSILDNNLPQTMAANLVWFWKAAAIILMCMQVGWYLALLILPMFVIYARIAKRYLPAVRDLRRLDAAARSPIFSHFSESMAGVTTIRVMEDQRQAIACNMANLECQMEAYFLNNTAARWLGLRLQLCGTVLVGSVCMAGVALSTQGLLNAGILGLAITYAMNLSDTLAQVNRESADRETQMVSVERVHQYASGISRESELVEPAEARPPLSFMSQGALTVENVMMKYRPELPTVLNGISLKIGAGERIGIVGRTGCGKSSFLTALMRLVQIQDGRFSIDGVDLSTIGLHTLRSKVAIIPQDPAILTGTIRFNLDPFGHNSDQELWSVLEKSQLNQRVTDAGGLDSIVEEGGNNYSVGELQLLCMARALLRRQAFATGGGLLLLDEATSALDAETDDIIQKVIRNDFKCTTITIAHRIQTLLDYDRVVVLSAGQVVEFDSPKALLSRPSEFQSLAREGGVQVASASSSWLDSGAAGC